MPNIPAIAVTMGDPGGIGPEITAQVLASRRLPRAAYLLMGSGEVYRFLKKSGVRLSAVPVKEFPTRLRRPGKYFVDIDAEARTRYPAFFSHKIRFHPRKISACNAALAGLSLEQATQAALAGHVAAVVTAPLNKTAMRLIDSGFIGHTEYLASAARIREFAMMFLSPRLKVTLVTIHVPVKRIASLIRQDAVFSKIRLTHDFLKRYYKIRRPRLGVCALNPHGKETGTEEDRQIVPAVRRARRRGIQASGPFSADQLFFEAYEGRYDALISMYHDQALAPFKMIAFRDGVNVTLGLPFIRTSPDHGTAYDIAYRGKADPVSFRSALETAVRLVR